MHQRPVTNKNETHRQNAQSALDSSLVQSSAPQMQEGVILLAVQVFSLKR